MQGIDYPFIYHISPVILPIVWLDGRVGSPGTNRSLLNSFRVSGHPLIWGLDTSSVLY